MDQNGVSVNGLSQAKILESALTDHTTSTTTIPTAESMQPNCCITLDSEKIESTTTTSTENKHEKKPSFDLDVPHDQNPEKKNHEETNGNVPVRNGDAISGSGKTNKTGRISTSSAQHGGVVKYSRIFKKVSPDGNMVLFLPQREIMVTETKVEPLMGVALIHQVSITLPKLNYLARFTKLILLL
jgi:hypothetical protein